MEQGMLFDKIKKIGIVPVVKLEDAQDAKPLAKALCDGGLPCAEVTFRTEQAADAIKNMKEAYPKSDIEKFVNSLTTPSNLFTGVGIMLAALFMLFKSREIS